MENLLCNCRMAPASPFVFSSSTVNPDAPMESAALSGARTGNESVATARFAARAALSRDAASRCASRTRIALSVTSAPPVTDVAAVDAASMPRRAGRSLANGRCQNQTPAPSSPTVRRMPAAHAGHGVRWASSGTGSTPMGGEKAGGRSFATVIGAVFRSRIQASDCATGRLPGTSSPTSTAPSVASTSCRRCGACAGAASTSSAPTSRKPDASRRHRGLRNSSS